MKCFKKADLLLLANKLIQKTPDIWKIRKKNTKSIKQSKTFENPNIVDIKSIITEHHINYPRL